MSSPNKWIFPLCGRNKPMISFSKTDFPVPLPPMMATTSPRATSRLTPSCTVLLPKRVTT
jgi:hypothetical protein